MQYSKKESKTIAIVLLLAFMFTMMVPASAFAAFSDVPNNHWAIQQLDRVAARGIMGGYEDGTARPNNSVTQFEAIAMASRMMGLEYDEATQKGTYLPFKYPDWAGAYNTCVAAYKAGLIDANDFTHNGAASREWVAKLLILAMDAEDKLSGTANEKLFFSDTSSISNKYLDYVKLAYDKGLLGGYTDGTFKPKNAVTRAELAAFLCRVENQLDTVSGNVVRGEVTAVSGVKVTLNGEDGKAYSLYATTTSTLYDENGKKIGVTNLKAGDKVYIVYKNNLLNYLEVQSDVVAAGSETALYGDIRAIIDVKNTIIVMDSDENLHTVVVDNGTIIKAKNSNEVLTFGDLQELMTVSLRVSDRDQTASAITIEANAYGHLTGTIYNVDVYEKLITMQESSGLKTYEMADSMKVSISGMLTATASSLKEGDHATYDIENGKMVAIAVGSSSDNYGGNAQIKTVDTANRIITYMTTADDFEAAYYTAGLTVTFKDGDTGTINDLQTGDSVKLTISNNQITAIQVTSRNMSEGLAVTLYSVDTVDELVTVTDENNNLKSYILADNVKVILYGETSSLGYLTKGMKVELTLQNNEVIRIKANDLIEGVVKSLSTSKDTIQVAGDEGTVTYDVADAVTVERYRSSSSYLGNVSIGDTVSMKVENNLVTEIFIHEQVDMTIVDMNYSTGRVRLQDDDGNGIYRYLDEVDVYVGGVYTHDVDELGVGDDVIATFTGSTLVKLEAESVASGEVTSINTAKSTITIKTFNNDVRTVNFDSNSYIVKNGVEYTSLNKLNVGDRVLMDTVSGDKEFTVLKSKTGEVRFATGTSIRFQTDSTDLYTVVNNYYCHKIGSTSEVSFSSLSTGGKTVTVYYTDMDNVYEVVVH